MSDERTPQRLGPWGHVAIALGYLALALWLTWPAAAQPGARYHTAGQNIFFFPATPDAPQNIWNFWWAARAVGAGLSPFTTPLLYYPEGAQMVLQTMNSTAVLLALPVTAALGPTAAYNATAIAAVALTGYAGFLLARCFAPGLAGPLLAGALLTAAPFHIVKLDSGQLNFVTMQWLVFFVLAIVQLSRSSRWWWPPLAALAFALVLYTDWYWALVAALFGATWAALSLVGRDGRRPTPALSIAGGTDNRRVASPRSTTTAGRRSFAAPGAGALTGRYLAFALLAALSALPLALALRGQPVGRLREQSAIWSAYTRGYSADALGLFFPAAGHPLWAERAERFLVGVAPLGITEGSYTAAGWTLAALATLGVVWHWRRHWRLLVTALVAWLLAVGPTLTLLGYDTGLAMPYRLLQTLPLLSTARRPNLFGVITIVVAAMFAALAIARLRERLPPRRYALALGAVAALGLFELWPPVRVAHQLPRPAVFTRIAAEPGVVVDLPIEGDTNSRTLINQMVHGQPILRGYVARPPSYPTLVYSPLPSQLGRLRPWPEDDIVALDRETLATMQCYYRLRYLVLDKTLLTLEQQLTARELAGRLGDGPPGPWHEDGQFLAYRLPLHEDRCAPFVFLGSGWHDHERSDAGRWRWSMGRGELYAVNPGAGPTLLGLELRAEGREDGQPLELWHEGRLVARLSLGRAERRYRVALRLPPGQSHVELRTPAVVEPGSGRELGIAVSEVGVR